MTLTPEAHLEATRRERRRQNRREIVLPFVLGVVGTGLLVLVVAVVGRDGQSSLVANLLGTVMFLCPLALCTFPLVLLMVVSVYGMGRLNGALAHPLRRLEGLTVRLKQSVATTSAAVADKTIAWSSRYEQFDRAVLSKLDRMGDRQDSESPPDVKG